MSSLLRLRVLLLCSAESVKCCVGVVVVVVEVVLVGGIRCVSVVGGVV